VHLAHHGSRRQREVTVDARRAARRWFLLLGARPDWRGPVAGSGAAASFDTTRRSAIMITAMMTLMVVTAAFAVEIGWLMSDPVK
jgi:hypothetical protein